MSTDEKALRRKIAAAKSYLSRLDNQKRDCFRSVRTGNSGITEYNLLAEKRNTQYEKFRSLCNQLRG